MVATVMVKDCDLQSESATAHCNSILVSPRRERSDSQPDLLSLTQPSTQIRLALEELSCFEMVEHQFQSWGITFINAITLQPSNPVFGVDPEAMVLMGAPKSGWLEIYFATPIRRIEAGVISSRPTVLSAYNSMGEEIAQTEMTLVKPKSHTHPTELPKARLSLACAGISKITFYAFDGQLVISQLLFEF
ncbi:MAG: hypothetical protein ACRC8A_14175, partial [Microcoleaceae cyanobacterium]